MRLIGFVLLLLSITTCGQEGPLYLPEEYLPQEPNPAAGYVANPPTWRTTS
jgi:predicted small lipoprotein YifL